MARDSEYTKIISLEEAYQEYCRNEEMYRILENRCYVYAEERFVLNDPKFVQMVDGQLVLTDYAWDNLSDCSLSFEVVRQSNDTHTEKEDFAPPKINNSKYLAAVESENHGEWIQHVLEVQQEIVNQYYSTMTWKDREMDCWDMLERFIEVFNIRIYEFEKDTGLHTNYFRRAIKKMKRPERPQKSAIIVFAIAYNLPISMAEKFLEAAGYVLSDSNDNDRRYRLALNLTGTPMKYKAKWLADNGVPFLSEESLSEMFEE